MSLLTEQEVYELGLKYHLLYRNTMEFARDIESAVIEKIKAQGPVAWRFDISEDSYNQKWGLTESVGLAKSGDPRAQPLYRLPEGE